VYVIFLVHINLENDEVLGIIDFETICSYTSISSNISLFIGWNVLLIDPNLWIEKL
jgi:hypothetical protein